MDNPQLVVAGDNASGRSRSSGEVADRRIWSRMLVIVMLFVAVLLSFGVATLLPVVQGLLTKQDKLLAAELEGMSRIPDMAARLDRLNEQMTILSTASVDA